MALCRASTGAWVNYAIGGLVFAAVLTGRALSRACDGARLRSSLFAIAVASLAVLSYEIREAYNTFRRLRIEQRSVEVLLGNLKLPAEELYFAGRPGMNRLYGRTDLVFDDWLYPVFESVHLAEPRASWLRDALTDGSVRFVITTSRHPRIDGVRETLGSLGYVPRSEFESLYVWERLRSAAGDPSGSDLRAASGPNWLWRSKESAIRMNRVESALWRSRLPRKTPHDQHSRSQPFGVSRRKPGVSIVLQLRGAARAQRGDFRDEC